MNRIEGGITAPQGFQAAGVAAGIKPGSTKRDCALVASDGPAQVAGMFTRNIVKAAPVVWDIAVCRRGTARAVFVNSGNANALTGEQGWQDTESTARAIGEHLGCAPEDVCVCSTGVIGAPLPMDRILEGVQGCVAGLAADGSRHAAEAIMTTDTVPKELAAEVPLASGTVRIGCIAKGAGMIAPNMATMIAILTTDAAIDPGHLKALLRPAVEQSFHCISVDNDMSTSDTVLCLANGRAGGARIAPESPDYAAFGEALAEVCREAALMLVRDGEGATKLVEIRVSGTASHEEARQICRAIAHSQLCKTAFYGEDANWGRIACAAGYAGVDFDPNRLSIWLDDLQLLDDGRPAGHSEEEAAAIMKRPSFRLRVSTGDGPGEAVHWTSDLSHEYVSINADYRT